MAGVWDLAAPA